MTVEEEDDTIFVHIAEDHYKSIIEFTEQMHNSLTWIDEALYECRHKGKSAEATLLNILLIIEEYKREFEGRFLVRNMAGEIVIDIPKP